MARPLEQREKVLALYRLGVNPFAIARTTGIPRSTLREWIRPTYVPRQGAARRTPSCFRCDRLPVRAADEYTYLLALYLGDGHMTLIRRGVWRLRIYQDEQYVDLIRRCMQTMNTVSGRRVGLVAQRGCVAIYGHWKHWIHLIPQHGPGMKHQRSIVLEPWQREVVTQFPMEFLKGLIHSDGSRSLNTIKSSWRGAPPRTYMYPRYFFSNASEDILRLFCETCDLLGVRWTRTNARNVAVSRRPDVAFLDTFIGPKS